MGKIIYYDVWEDDKIILENVTSKEIQEHFGTEYLSMGYFTSGKNYYKDRYLLARHGAGQPESPKAKPEDTKTVYVSEEWKQEWTDICGKLRKGIAKRTIHKKILPEYFREVEEGNKNFEIRKDEDDIQPGDILVLEEWEENYTGASVTRKVRYVLRNVPEYGLMEGYCIIGW